MLQFFVFISLFFFASFEKEIHFSFEIICENKVIFAMKERFFVNPPQ